MRDDSLRVMLLVSNLEIGGAQEIVRTLSEHFLKEGLQPVVCAFKDGPLRSEIERFGIPVEIVPDRRYSVVALPRFIKELIRIRRNLLSLVDKYKINVIHTQLLRSLDFLVLSLRLDRKVLVFWSIHNEKFTLREEHLPRYKWLLGIKKWGHRVLYKIGSRWVSGIIVVAEDVRKEVVGYFGELEGKITLIINSVDINRYQTPGDRKKIRHELGIDETSPVMALVATFKVQKGHRYLIDAMSIVCEKFPGLHLLFIGDGELRNELKEQVYSLNLEKQIHFLGIRKDVPGLLSASDYFVLPSLWEGLPMALLEAMASGLPVIATDVSGTREVVVNEKSGILVEPGNVSQLADAMILFLSDPDKAKTMGNFGYRRVVEHFSVEKQTRDHIALYHRCLETL